jgi:hypothetical protein
MNDRYEHLLRKARDAKRGGHEAWTVQSTGERVAVALVLNRADWLAEIDYTIAEAIERSGSEWVAIIPQLASNSRRRAEMVTRSVTTWRAEALGMAVAVVLALALVATSTGCNALAWIYLQSAEAIERGVHLPFSLDRLDPTCPQSM